MKTRKQKSKKNAKKANSKIEKTSLESSEKQGRVKRVAPAVEHPFEAHPSLLQIRVGLVKQRTAGIDKFFQLKKKPGRTRNFKRPKNYKKKHFQRI